MTERRRCAIIFKNSIFVSEPVGLKALPMGGRTTAPLRRLRVGEETLPLSVFEKETAGCSPQGECRFPHMHHLRMIGTACLSDRPSFFMRERGIV